MGSSGTDAKTSPMGSSGHNAKTTSVGSFGRHQAFLPLLVVAGTGAAYVGVAFISSYSSGLWGKIIPVLKQHSQQNALLKVAFGKAREDRISRLPDDLLSYIISQLDLTEAVRTRILAKSWKDICKVRSKLVLDCRWMCGECQDLRNGSRCHKQRFFKAVDQALELYSGQKIVEFHLICCLGKKELASSFLRWMQTVPTFGVQVLVLEFCALYRNGDIYPLPLQLLLEATSLTKLHLINCVLQPSLKGKFSSLQYLYLITVPLDNQKLRSILSSCVNLRWMSLFDCKLPSKLCISGQLLKLSVTLCIGVKEIDIDAANLSYLYFYSHQMVEFSLHYAPKLKDLFVSVNGSDAVPYLFGEVINKCPELKQFAVQTKTNKLQYMPAKMSVFRNLRMLSLLMLLDSVVDLQIIATVLDSCPCLQSLRLLARSSRSHGGEHREEAWPGRHYSHLRQLRYDGFCGTDGEIEFVSYLLQSAPELKLVLLHSVYSTYSADFKWSQHTGHTVDDVKRQMICTKLEEHALSSELKVVFDN